MNQEFSTMQRQSGVFKKFCRRAKNQCGVRLLLLFVFFALYSCSKHKPPGVYLYQLSEGGYSPTANALLLVLHADYGERLRGVLLATYDIDKSELKRLLTSITPNPFDFAWSPTKDLFVTTHGPRMSLFRKDESPDGYTGTPIRCPLSFLYTFCAWDTRGEWLAVTCTNMRESGPHRLRLGLYNLATEEFVVSKIPITQSAPIWKDDTTLYVPNVDSILEVTIDAGAPKIVRSIPIEKGFLRAHGVFGGKVLISTNDKVKLGDRILVESDQTAETKVLTTQELIFILEYPGSLVAFDHQGNEVGKTTPGREIRFFSVGEVPSVLYGIAGSVLLRIHVKDGEIYIRELSDLANFENRCQNK